jgi:hypothetical protein
VREAHLTLERILNLLEPVEGRMPILQRALNQFRCLPWRVAFALTSP